MVRFWIALVSIFVFSVGCSPEAAKKMTDTASDKMSDAAKGAKSDLGAGMSDLMGKATEALSSVEGGSDMLKQVSEMFAKATSTFGGIKDTDSATAALPDLGKLTEGFGGLADMYAKLPDAAKKAVAGVFESSMSKLKPTIDKVMAIPGVEAILKPAIDSLMSKLGAFKA